MLFMSMLNALGKILLQRIIIFCPLCSLSIKTFNASYACYGLGHNQFVVLFLSQTDRILRQNTTSDKYKILIYDWQTQTIQLVF